MEQDGGMDVSGICFGGLRNREFRSGLEQGVLSILEVKNSIYLG